VCRRQQRFTEVGGADLRRVAGRGDHWTGRAMANVTGVFLRSVQRI
jgi:hypothetical protein